MKINIKQLIMINKYSYLYYSVMTHIESITKFFVVVTGFASLSGIYLFSNKLSNRIVKYYFYSYMSLFLYHVADLIYRYISITFTKIEFNLILCFTTILYFIICGYVINVIKLTSEIIEVKKRTVINIICNTVATLYSAIYIIGLAKGDMMTVTKNINVYLWSYGMLIFSQLLQFRFFYYGKNLTRFLTKLPKI